MDHYPEVNVSERECASRRTSQSSSSTKPPSNRNSLAVNTKASTLSTPHYTSFPTPPASSEKEALASERQRVDSVTSTADIKVAELETKYAEILDAPPPYSEKQYEGKSEDEQSKMRMLDYAKELKRMMGRQLVRGLKSEAKQ